MNPEEELTKLLEEQIQEQIDKEIWEPILESTKDGVIVTTKLCSNKVITDGDIISAASPYMDSGEEDGVKWFVDYDKKQKEWVVTVSNGTKAVLERFSGYQPQFGVDLGDANRIEEILDKLINELR